jgi:2-polyprenyl-3-methyl-5-hydroxy-6-metoxy-1,4-benzoquinol methylase
MIVLAGGHSTRSILVRSLPWSKSTGWIEEWVRSELRAARLPALSIEAMPRPGGARVLQDGSRQLHSGTVVVRFVSDLDASAALALFAPGPHGPTVDGRPVFSSASAEGTEVSAAPARPAAAPRMLVAAQRRQHQRNRRERELSNFDAVLTALEASARRELPAEAAPRRLPLPQTVAWAHVPRACDPCFSARRMREGSLRGERKRETVAVFAELLAQALAASAHATARELTVVDCGCGTGNLLLPLATLSARNVRFVGVDMKQRSLQLLEERAAAAGPELAARVGTACTSIEMYDGPCDAIVSLHACGGASDMALELARQRGVPYIVSPCCVGKLSRGPRSGWLSQALAAVASSQADAVFTDLAAWADASAADADAQTWARRGRAKVLVEQDRLAAAVEAGGFGALLEMGGLVAEEHDRGTEAPSFLTSSHLSHVLVGRFDI